MEQLRGQLTDRIKAKSRELLGYEINVTELRLMPYIMYVMQNTYKLDIQRINGDERKILRKWKEAGYIEGGASGLLITRAFWDIMCELVFLGYVDLSG